MPPAIKQIGEYLTQNSEEMDLLERILFYDNGYEIIENYDVGHGVKHI